MMRSTMYKRAFIPRSLFVLLTMLMKCLIATAGEPSDPLDRQIPSGMVYNSFDEAIRRIEQKTGFKVSVSKDLQTFMQTIWLKRSFGSDKITTTVRTFLDDSCQRLSLKWKVDKETDVLALEPRWKTSDPRQPSELLEAVWRQGYGAEYGKTPAWQTAFDALLSKDTNYETAWKVMQKSSLRQILPSPATASKPLLTKEIIDRAGNKRVLVLCCQPIEMIPGNGSVSYYVFKRDGTLIDAGLMNTGHRCEVIDAAIDDELSTMTDKFSELQIISKWNMYKIYIARFALEADGLKLAHLVDGHGAEENNNGMGIGESLMGPDQE